MPSDDAKHLPSGARIDRMFASELRELRDRILLMAGRIEEMITHSVRAVGERDAELARRTIQLDRQVNADELACDELCLQVLAKRHPVASDLRFVTRALKMVTDLERIGDLAVNISERAIDLAVEPALRPLPELARMAELAQSMVRDAIDAFVSSDVTKARAVLQRDDLVDELYHQTFRDLLAHMAREPAALERGIHVQSVAKFIERIADHATNIAEQVVFMVEGKEIRHAGKR